MSKRQIFIFFTLITILSSGLTFGEEKPDIKLPGITIIGKDRSQVQEKIKPEKTIIEIKEEGSLAKDLIKEPAIEIDLPSIEDVKDKPTILKKKNITSSFTISRGNFDSLKYQYLYGQKIKEANILFIVKRDRSGGFIVNNQRFDKHSMDETSLNLDLPLKIPELKRDLFLSTEVKYKENEEDLPFKQDREIFEDFSLSLKSSHFKVWDSTLDLVLTNTKAKLAHEKSDKTESNEFCFDAYFYTNLKRYFSKSYPLNINLEIQNESLEKDKRWNYLILAESNNIEIKNYTLNIGANYHNYKGSSALGCKLNAFYPYRKNIKLFTTLKRDLERPLFSKVYANEKYVEVGSYSFQKQNSAELGLRYQIKEDFLVSSFLFAQETKDFISWRDVNGNQLYEPFDIQKVSISGLGLKFKKDLFPNITCHGDLIYNSSIKNKAPGQYVPFIPKEEAKATLKISDFKGLNVEFVGIYKGTRYAYHDQNIKLKSFLLIDFKVYKNIDKNLHLFISGDNLFNQKYQLRKNYFGDLATIRAGITIKI